MSITEDGLINKKGEERTCCPTKRIGKSLSLRCPFSWKGRAEKCTRRVAGRLRDKSWKGLWMPECFQLRLETHVLLIRLLKLDYEPQGVYPEVWYRTNIFLIVINIWFTAFQGTLPKHLEIKSVQLTLIGAMLQSRRRDDLHQSKIWQDSMWSKVTHIGSPMAPR